MNNSLHLARKGYLSAARGHCELRRTDNVRAYFRPKWRLSCLLSFKSFSQSAQFEIGGYINNSFHLARKYAGILVVRGHYLFRETNSFPRAQLEENCELRGTDNVQGQISEHIFAPNGGYRPLSRGGHFESQGNKKLCFCPSSLALDERLDGQNLLFQHCVIKLYCLCYPSNLFRNARSFEN